MEDINERNEKFLLLDNKEKVIEILKMQRKHHLREREILRMVLDENLEKNRVMIPKMEERLIVVCKEIINIDKDILFLEGIKNG